MRSRLVRGAIDGWLALEAVATGPAYGAGLCWNSVAPTSRRHGDPRPGVVARNCETARAGGTGDYGGWRPGCDLRLREPGHIARRSVCERRTLRLGQQKGRCEQERCSCVPARSRSFVPCWLGPLPVSTAVTPPRSELSTRV
jgi:hypothetical protein